MKYNNTFYIQLSRVIFTEKYKSLSTSAKWLYCVLNELEYRYSREDGLFYRTNEELARDAGISLATLKRAKKELVSSCLITTIQTNLKEKESGKTGKTKITVYKLQKV